MTATLRIRESTFQELHDTAAPSYKLDLVLVDGRTISCEGLMARVLYEFTKLGDPVLDEREECARIADDVCTAWGSRHFQEIAGQSRSDGAITAAETIIAKIRARSDTTT